MSKPLTFAELKLGEYFIAFPTDGDDGGHGGFRGTSFVFKKIGFELDWNAEKTLNGVRSTMPPSMQVLRVES